MNNAHRLSLKSLFLLLLLAKERSPFFPEVSKFHHQAWIKFVGVQFCQMFVPLLFEFRVLIEPTEVLRARGELTMIAQSDHIECQHADLNKEHGK